MSDSDSDGDGVFGYLRQNTDESDFGVSLRQSTASGILDGASEEGIVTPIPNNTTQEDFKQLEIIVELAKNNTRSGPGSLKMIVQNGKYGELEFHRSTRYSELNTLAGLIYRKEFVLGFPGSLCDKTSTYSKKCTRTRTYNIQEYFNNVIYVYGEYGWEENDKFLEFLQEKNKWRVSTRQERENTTRGGGKKTRKRNRKRKGGKKTSKRKRKGKRKPRKRKTKKTRRKRKKNRKKSRKKKK